MLNILMILMMLKLKLWEIQQNMRSILFIVAEPKCSNLYALQINLFELIQQS